MERFHASKKSFRRLLKGVRKEYRNQAVLPERAKGVPMELDGICSVCGREAAVGFDCLCGSHASAVYPVRVRFSPVFFYLV